MFYIHTCNVSSTNDSHVVMLTSVQQLTYFDNMSYARSSSFNFRCANDDLSLFFFLGECFDADDDNGRICGSITPDTVLYTLFRGKMIK